MSKNTVMHVQGHNINMILVNGTEYISLTDLANSHGDDTLIYSWMRNRNTVEFLGLWEGLNNQNFKGHEFVTFRNASGSNNFNLTPQKWVLATDAIGIMSKSGKGGGTYAHREIALEFCSWISPALRLYIIKEFDRLKELESRSNNQEWDVRRLFSKANYHLQTLAIKEYRIPNEGIPKDREGYAYAEEADILNYAVFGYSAKAWQQANPEAVKQGLNARDVASINELNVLSSMESMNSVMIRSGMPKYERGIELRRIAQQQLETLNKVNPQNSTKKIIEPKQKLLSPLKSAQQIANPELSDFNKKLKHALNFNPKEEKPK